MLSRLWLIPNLWCHFFHSCLISCNLFTAHTDSASVHVCVWGGEKERVSCLWPLDLPLHPPTLHPSSHPWWTEHGGLTSAPSDKGKASLTDLATKTSRYDLCSSWKAGCVWEALCTDFACPVLKYYSPFSRLFSVQWYGNEAAVSHVTVSGSRAQSANQLFKQLINRETIYLSIYLSIYLTNLSVFVLSYIFYHPFKMHFKGYLKKEGRPQGTNDNA